MQLLKNVVGTSLCIAQKYYYYSLIQYREGGSNDLGFQSCKFEQTLNQMGSKQLQENKRRIGSGSSKPLGIRNTIILLQCAVAGKSSV